MQPCEKYCTAMGGKRRQNACLSSPGAIPKSGSTQGSGAGAAAAPQGPTCCWGCLPNTPPAAAWEALGSLQLLCQMGYQDVQWEQKERKNLKQTSKQHRRASSSFLLQSRIPVFNCSFRSSAVSKNFPTQICLQNKQPFLKQTNKQTH